jgi:hypothetical protein
MPRRKAFASSPPDGKAYQVRIYVFYIGRGTKPAQFTEAENWRPLSYADAEAGIITNKYTGEVRSTEFFREQAEDSYIYLPLTSSPVVLVAVNEYDKYYAWRAFKYESPMPRIVISVMFDLKKSTAENPYFKDSSNGWIVTAEQFETGQ